MTEIDDTTWHIYAKDRCLYHNLTEEEFEEKWELLKVMIDLLGGDYTQDDLSYERLAPKLVLVAREVITNRRRAFILTT